jgi:TadE-like protein
VLDAVVRRVRSLTTGDGREYGAAIAEFVLVSVLLVFLLFAVLQVAVYFYVRNIVAASAADGARYASGSGVDYAAGGIRATTLVEKGLKSGVARDIPCAGGPGADAATGLPLVVVRCAGRIRSIFLPIGAFISIDVRSGALKEGQP